MGVSMWREIIKRYRGMPVAEALDRCLKERIGFVHGKLQVQHEWYGLGGSQVCHFDGLNAEHYRLSKPVVSFHRHFTIHWTDNVFDHRMKLPRLILADDLNPTDRESLDRHIALCHHRYADQLIELRF